MVRDALKLINQEGEKLMKIFFCTCLFVCLSPQPASQSEGPWKNGQNKTVANPSKSRSKHCKTCLKPACDVVIILCK